MLREKTGIGPGLMFCLVFSSVFGFGVMNAPLVAVKYGGSNGYWGVILALALAVPVIAATVYVGNKFPNKSVIEYLPAVFGKVVGKTLGFVFLVFVLVISAFATRLIGELFSEYFLPRTPLWAILLLVGLTAVFVAHKGVEGISRVAAFIFPVAVFFIFLSVIISFQGFAFDRVQPLFLIDGLKLPYGALQMFYCFFPMATVLAVYPYLTEKNKGFKIVFTATLLAVVPIFVMVFSAVGIYGYKGVLRYGWPTLQMTTKANLPYLLQTFGIFFAVAWYSQIALATSGLYYAAAQGFSELFGALNYKWVLFIVFPLIMVLTLAVPGVIEFREIFRYIRIAGFGIIFTLPLVVWLITLITKTGETRHAS
ncbi:MAG: hypothetical protein CVU89_15650 [Firmicutes bacterium HGW-Firmicutes-14]|nr:MAG: hypothetical protein CVU89_15650 [Firmicutes bacterium HGW-Firmicutes-14]